MYDWRGQWNDQGLVNVGLTSLKIPCASGKQLCCFVLKSKWKGFKLDIRRNCALGLFEWTSPSWALSEGLGRSLHCSIAVGLPKPIFWTRVWTLPVHLLASRWASTSHWLFVLESPVCWTWISCDEWVPKWAHNDYINLTVNLDSVFRTRITEPQYNWNSISQGQWRRLIIL